MIRKERVQVDVWATYELITADDLASYLVCFE